MNHIKWQKSQPILNIEDKVSIKNKILEIYIYEVEDLIKYIVKMFNFLALSNFFDTVNSVWGGETACQKDKYIFQLRLRIFKDSLNVLKKYLKFSKMD